MTFKRVATLCLHLIVHLNPRTQSWLYSVVVSCANTEHLPKTDLNAFSHPTPTKHTTQV